MRIITFFHYHFIDVGNMVSLFQLTLAEYIFTLCTKPQGDPKMAIDEDAQILNIKQVSVVTGLKRSSIYNYMSLNKFPKSKKIGKRKVGWLKKDIDKWIKSL